MVVTYLGAGPLMACADDPYVSKFEFASRFHPSQNPNCTNGWNVEPDDGNEDFHGSDFAPLRSRRSPEEGSPVGQEPSIEVRAILVRCPRNEEEADDVLINRNIYNITAGRSKDILDFHGFDRDEPARHSEVRDCRRKLIITMKFNNIGRTKTQEEFVVIDHVMDPVTMHKSRLLNPFVVKVRQEPVLQLYGLKFQGVVNAEAREEVISKKMSNYTGCDDVSENPTCGQMILDGKPIPYSQGFCCSCDPEMNVKREASLSNDSAIRPFPSFFSKNRDRPMKPFKSPRSVNENFLDDLSDSEETFQKESAMNEGHDGNPDKVNVDHDPYLFKEDSNPAKILQDDERDLIDLKNANRSQRSQSNESRINGNRQKNAVDAREFSRYVNESIPNYEKTESRVESSFHSHDRVNLTAALMRLEEDYKNLRLSSMIKAAGRNNGSKMTVQQNKLQPPGGKWSGQSVNENRFEDDSQQHVSTSTYPGNLVLPTEGSSHGRLPTLSIDVLLAVRPKQEPTSPVHSNLLTTCPMVQLTANSVIEPATPAVLRQKVVSDRVYPSVKETVAHKFYEGREIGHSSSTEVTMDLSQKFGADEVQENVAESNEREVFSNTQLDIDRSGLGKMHNATSSEDSMTTSWNGEKESAFTSAGTTENLRVGHDDPAQSFDNLSSQVESPANSSPSFSSGNHSKGDAIPPSGSLKNQLANWFPREKGRKFRRRKGRKKKLGKDDAVVGEIGHNGEVGSFEPAVPTPASDYSAKGHRYDDQSTTSFDVRGPVQVYFKPDRTYEPPYEADHEKSIEKMHRMDENIVGNIYSDPEEKDVLLKSKLRRQSGPRSYRSIADDEPFTNKDDNLQRSIDKKIEDEFADISEVLKDAADTPKVIRGRPSSGSTFENDDSVIEKFDRIDNDEKEKYGPFLGDATMRDPITYDGNLKRGDDTFGNTARLEDHENQSQSTLVKHTEEFSEPVSDLPLTTGHQIIVDRFKIVKTFQDLPESYKHTTRSTFVGPKARHLTTSESNTASGSEIIPTRGPKTIPDGFTPVEHVLKVLNDKTQQENIVTRSNLEDNSPSIGHLKEKDKFFTTTTLQPISSDTSVENALYRSSTAIPMIENLKKELREEAQRYSSSTSPLRSASTNPKGLQRYVNEVREASTALTPAEKVEDSVTDEGTLPPDEETKVTTVHLDRTTIMPRNVHSDSVIEEKKVNYASPEIVFQVMGTNLPSDGSVIPSKRNSKMLILLEESSRSSEPSLHRRRKKTHRKRHHRRHHRHQIRRHRRHSAEPKLNGTYDIGSTISGRVVTNGKSENEDDEHPWYETTTHKNMDDVKTSGRKVTTTVASNNFNSLASKNLHRRDLSLDVDNTMQNQPRVNESANKSKSALSSGKLYVSLSRIPENDHHSRLAGLRVEEIPKVEGQQESEANRDRHEFEASMMYASSEASEAPGQIDEMPIFQTTESPSKNDRPVRSKSLVVGEDDSPSARKIRNDKETQKRNYRTLSTPKFRSLYPKSNEVDLMFDTVVDEATASEDVGRNNKRDGLTKIDEGNPEALVFYDYDAIDEPVTAVTEGENDENKRSLRRLERENKNFEFQSSDKYGRTALVDKKDRRTTSMSGDQYQIEPSSGWKEKMELLKLKKHADVLKEYLNWRHDIVPSDPHEISGYTTKISMTNEIEGTSETIANSNFNMSNETTLSSTIVTHVTVTDDVSTTTEDQKTSTTMMSTINKDDVTRETETSSSSTIANSTTVNHSGIGSSNESNTTYRIETSTCYLDHGTTINEDSTGRILPPCCHTTKELVTTCSTGLQANVDHYSSRPHLTPNTSPKGISGRRGRLSDVEKDLVIISILEKNQRRNKNTVNNFVNFGGKSSARVERIREDDGQGLVSHHRRRKSNNKIRYSATGSSRKAERRAGRRLMSVEDSEYKANNDVDDFMLDEFEDNLDNVELPVDGDANALNNDEDSEKLKNKWNQLIVKIVRNSSEFWEPANSTELSLLELRGDHKSAMKELHFANADRYIKKMAKKITHNTNYYDTKPERSAFDDKNRLRKHVSIGRKLTSHQRLANKLVRKFSTRDNNDFDETEDPDESVGNERSAPRLKMEDSYNDSYSSSALQPNPASGNADANVSDYQESSDRQSGRDFAISLSGKIHVEGGTNGQPMSISFDTSPEIANRNETLDGGSDGTSDLDNSRNNESVPSSNFLSSIFNIASAPKDLVHHSQESTDNLNSSESGTKSSRRIVATNLQPFSEDNHRKSPHLVKKSAVIRRSRAVDEGRFPKYRADRSFDLEDSQDLIDIPEKSESEDYPDSQFAYDDDSEHEGVDDSEISEPSSDVNSDVNQGHDVDATDVKVLKIIPLASDGGHDELKEDTKASRMTASQLPNMDDDLVPGATVKPGKIKPAKLPWGVNGDEKMLVPSIEASRSDSKAPGSCSSTSESRNSDNDALEASSGRVSTRKPMSLKVIGLVNMEEPPISRKKNPKGLLDDNYEIVPLIHVKIQQQPDARPDNRVNVSCGRMKGCPKLEMTKSHHRFRGDSCSDMNDEADITENDSDQPEAATMNMDNDEELREPSGIGSCSDSNSANGPIGPNFAENDRSNRLRPCEDQRGTTTTQKPSCNVQDVRNEARKRIRLKNMLAMMEFVNKLREIMGGEETRKMADADAVIDLGNVVVLPINGTRDTSARLTGVDEATDRFVVMGEGVKHHRLQNSVTSYESQPEVKATSSNSDNTSKNRSDTSNWKGQKDQDESFLFSGNNEKIEGVKQATYQDPKYRDLSLMDRGEVRTDHPNEGSEGQEPSESLNEVPHNNEQFTTPQEPIANESFEKNVTNSSVVNPNDSSNGDGDPVVKNAQNGNETQERDVLENLQRKINDRLRGLKRDNLEKSERQDANLSSAKKERSVAVDDFPSISKIKRHHLRSFLRDPRRQIHQSRSLPTDGEVSRLRRQKFGRLAAGIPREKRRRKKKKKMKMKKRRKKKKQKKKKHKKKGKNLRDTEIRGKTWWPFGRQLMSLSEERVPDMNPDVDQILANRNRGVSWELRERRRVHRAKFPHGKRRKTKKRRKHKKPKRRKNKKKGKKAKTIGARSKRQITQSGTQVRGGQDCTDRRHPPNVNPAKYLESAHCLRFSDLWYSVYELENPIMEHTVYLQLFEKHNRADGTAHWEDLTQGSMVTMGTFTTHQRDSAPTIVFTYTGAKNEPQNRALNLDPSTERLLIPSPVSPKKASDYPEVRDGSGEYLVVKASAISKDGNDCDKAGVGFAAFSKQQDRCGRAKDSCLKNQPLAYWRHDMEARESGRRGCYFLSNFASVPSKPIKYNVTGSGTREYLGLEYHSAHVSAIDIQVRTDYNAIVRVGSSGRVTEVYVDSTAPEHTVVTVVISNMGLASSPYQPRIADCPTGLPVSWTKAKGIMQVIPPQRDQRVTLDLYGQLLLNGFHCSVEVVNHRGELVAMRRIRVQKMDRCFCVWHCLCACIGSVSGMGCQPMSPEHYHAAGFQGPVPVVTAETSVLMNAVKNVLMLSALLVLLLLILGMLKWFVGMFAPAVGRWGLDSLLEGSRIEKYLEPELRCRCVMTDVDGWPVHPDTGQRTVRLCSRKLEFVLNLIFFLTYPIAVCCTNFKRSLNSSRQRRCCPDESKMCLINEKGSCPKMICVSTYGDRRNTKLEAEDTRYVLNELKKSRESLANPKRTKKKDGDKTDPKILSKKSSHKNRSASDVSAKRLVDDLLKSRMVFRNLTEPIGGLRVPPGTAYSLRGYFLNAEDGGYRFITPCPFKQYWLIENDEKTASKPPGTYPSNLFMRSFGTARDVFESNELSLSPKGICINVQYQDDT